MAYRLGDRILTMGDKLFTTESLFILSGLTSYWNFQTTGSTIYDSVSGISATVGNTALFTTSGRKGNGWKTNLTQATNNTDAIYSSTNLSVANGASISWWMKKAPDYDYLKFQYGVGIRSWNTNKINGFMTGTYSNLDVVYVFTQTGTNNAGGPESRYTYQHTNAFTGTGWYHYVATLTGTDTYTQKLYVNGVLSTSYINSGYGVSVVYDKSYFTLGRHVDLVFNAGIYFDEVATWNRPLSQAEVTALYNSGNGLFY